MQYGIGIGHQVSPTQVALLINRRVTGIAVGDFECGWDVLVFDRVAEIGQARLTPGLSNTDAVHPRTGRPLTLVHHLPQAGFVPLGARLADGTPHPHAGTGFGLAVLLGFPRDHSDRNAHAAPDLHALLQLIQFAFDGRRFTVTGIRNLPHDGLLPGWHVLNRGLGSAIPDGEDLLVGLVAGRDDAVARAHAARLAAAGRKPYQAAVPPVGECYGSGLARFRRGLDGWTCVDFTPVPAYRPDMAFEPSLVRDLDGSLLMAMRGRGANVPPGAFDEGLENTYEHFRVYRSTDGGHSWESVIHEPGRRAPTPVTLNQAADGTLFMAGNPFRPLESDSHGGFVMKQRQRDTLAVWRLREDRRATEEPCTVLNCNAVLGPPRIKAESPIDNRWLADHPVSGSFRLSDGRFHTLMTFRLTDALTTSFGGELNPLAGVWIAQATGGLPRVNPWNL